MPEIAPFRALRFDPAVVGNLGAVIAPPYDVISETEREALERRSPYNAVHLILAREEPGDTRDVQKYTRARGLLTAWRTAGVLRRDPAPSLTVYEQRAVVAGAERVQRGLLTAVALVEPEAGLILPHERTMPKPVADRLALLEACEANLEPVFGVYEGEPGVARDILGDVASTEPLAAFTDPWGVHQRAWRLDDPDTVAALTAALTTAVVVIADGHHRYRTALEYRERRRAAQGAGPWDLILMFLSDSDSHGPALLPIHRSVSGIDPRAARERLRGPVALEPAPTSDPDALARLVAEQRGTGDAPLYGVLDGERAWLLRVTDPAAAAKAVPAGRSARWRDLDVAILHHLVFDELLAGASTAHVHSPAEAAGAVSAGASLAFLLAPVSVETVQALAREGESMPPKSTFFTPKPSNGIVIRPLNGE